jgi:hypothetical protein
MSRKIMGQGKLVLRRFGDSVTAETIGDLALATEGVETIEALRQLEASAAALYFGAWSGRAECAPRFAAKDLRRIPPHWSRYEGRRSVLASAASNRKAERPVNAMLNYLYSLVEAEAILACQAVGLDPGLGIVHADAKGRQSLALDIMEPVRPEVDGFVLDMVERRTFRKAEFTETSDGHVRLFAPLTHELAETMPLWAKSLGPIAEHVAHVFGKAMDGTYSAATPLTSRRHRDAQAVVKARKIEATRRAASGRVLQRPSVQPAALALWTCPDCIAPVVEALSAEAPSPTLATSVARRASPPTLPRRPRSGAGVVPPSRRASGRSRNGTGPIPRRSTTRRCSGGRSCRDSERCRSPRSWRRLAVARRPRPTTGAGSGRLTFRRGRHWLGW